MSHELKVAIEAAKKGAEVALTYFQTDLNIELKEDNTQVTIADKKTEEEIKSYILSKFPNAKFVGEETGGSISENEFWVIDPIDGTRSFVRGIPTWCVMISKIKNKKVQLGVVYFPCQKSIYYAQEDKGAYCNDKKIHVSLVGKLSDSFVNFGSPKYFKQKENVLFLIEETQGARSFETTYGNCLVAEGRLDVSVDAYGKVWDLAPFKVILEEAGGKITRIDGTEWDLEGAGGIMSNGLIHDEDVHIFNQK